MQAYKLDAVQVVADAKVTLQHILKRLGDDYQTGYGESINEVKTEWLNERSRLSQIQFKREYFDPEIKEQFDQNILNEYADALGTELTQSSVVLKLNEVVSPDSNVITSAGLFRVTYRDYGMLLYRTLTMLNMVILVWGTKYLVHLVSD